jgi:hypothetical protein
MMKPILAIATLVVLAVAPASKAQLPVPDSFNPGSSGAVSAIVLQTDGRVLVGGAFVALDGVARNRVGRLNSNGTLDAGFNPGSGANATVYCLYQQPNGKILIGGDSHLWEVIPGWR